MLRQIRLSNLLDMLNATFTSMKALTVDIFMKRIRAIGFSRVFDDHAFAGRLMANHVYHLCDDDRPAFLERPDIPIELNCKFPPEIVKYLAYSHASVRQSQGSGPNCVRRRYLFVVHNTQGTGDVGCSRASVYMPQLDEVYCEKQEVRWPNPMLYPPCW